MNVDRSRATLVPAAPDACQERLAREDAAAVGRKEREERELLGRQRDAAALDADLVRGPVDQKGADLQPLFRREFAPAPLEGADPRVELRRDARHHDEVVEAAGGIEARDLTGRER